MTGQRKRIALCGPLAVAGAPAAGGYEASNARLLALLAASGREVLPFAYPAVKTRGQAVKALAYLWRFASLAGQARRLGGGDVFHATPLARHFIRGEIAILRAARAAGARIVLDLRAGNKRADHEARGAPYRRQFAALLALADAVAVEGEVYLPFIRTLRPEVPVLYLPNFLPDADIPASAPQRQALPLRFVHVGAVSEEKGVRHAARLVAALAARGLPVRFDVFGRVDAGFARRLAAETFDAGWLVCHGAQPFAVIQAALAQAHFFLFLTCWRGEGHSNALTEAMSQGAVPVVTDHGFNREVAGPDAIMVPDREALDNAIALVERLAADPGELARRAGALVGRVRGSYSESAVRPVLSALYGD